MSWGNIAKVVRPLGGRKFDEGTRRNTRPYILDNGETVTAPSAYADERNVHLLSTGTLHTRLSRGGKWLNPEMLWSRPNENMARRSQMPKRYKE